MTIRTRTCNEAISSGRLRKAEQFLDAAATIREFADDEADVGDAYVTLLVHSGIAASDVVCCRELGKYAVGESHGDAADLMRLVRPDGPELAKALEVLLGSKTRAGYGYQPVPKDARARCARTAEKLLQAAHGRAV